MVISQKCHGWVYPTITYDYFLGKSRTVLSPRRMGISGSTYCSSIMLRLVCDTICETFPQTWQSLPDSWWQEGEKGQTHFLLTTFTWPPPSSSQVYICFLSLQCLLGRECGEVGGKLSGKQISQKKLIILEKNRGRPEIQRFESKSEINDLHQW